jgi:hypothetical protein
MFAHACKLGLEGVVSKVRDSAYASGRGNNWVKKTCAQRETLAIAGFALDEGKWDGIYWVGARATISSTPARSTTASTRSRPPTSASASSRSPEDAGLREAGRAQRHLGRAEAAGRHRVPGEVRRGKGPAPILQRIAGGPVIPVCLDARWPLRPRRTLMCATSAAATTLPAIAGLGVTGSGRHLRGSSLQPAAAGLSASARTCPPSAFEPVQDVVRQSDLVHFVLLLY